MMKLLIIDHSFKYEIENLCRVFFPNEKLEILYEPRCEGDYILTKIENAGDKLHFKVEVSLGDTVMKDSDERASDTDSDECEYVLAVLLYRLLTNVCGYTPRWGILTGVRPTKLMRRLIASEGGADGAMRYFTERLLVSPQKAELCMNITASEDKIISMAAGRTFSLYISIPFCPSRCSYCSFVSHSIEHAKALIAPYVELLCREIAETGRIAADLGLALSTVYFGGGTPSILSPEQIVEIMAAVGRSFDLSGVSEYTVEAGRPDTLDLDKLEAIHKGGATRISVNPQTMNDDVLREIGRRHTAAQTVEAMRMARSVGIDNINMDIIAGLPTDTVSGFKNTVERVCAMDPESVTVHTLSLKRASRLTREGYVKSGSEAEKMLNFAYSELPRHGYEPYYMYRQSKTLGNLENVGFSKSGYEGIYNVIIIDETHTILACGASAVTKLREVGGNYIERIFNFKYPYEYINRFDEILERKKGVYAFYEKY